MNQCGFGLYRRAVVSRAHKDGRREAQQGMSKPDDCETGMRGTRFESSIMWISIEQPARPSALSIDGLARPGSPQKAVATPQHPLPSPSSLLPSLVVKGKFKSRRTSEMVVGARSAASIKSSGQKDEPNRFGTTLGLGGP